MSDCRVLRDFLHDQCRTVLSHRAAERERDSALSSGHVTTQLFLSPHPPKRVRSSLHQQPQQRHLPVSNAV